MIHVLLTTGAMVFFIVAWNNGFFTGNSNDDFRAYMLTFVAKLAAFGIMALFWGLYSSLYRRHLEVISPNDKIYRNPSSYRSMCGQRFNVGSRRNCLRAHIAVEKLIRTYAAHLAGAVFLIGVFANAEIQCEESVSADFPPNLANDAISSIS